ncbi:unnamed protein product [Alopecurus aequalis]
MTPIILPPLPSYESPPWYHPPPPPPPSSDQGGVIMFLVVAPTLSLLGFFLCGVLKGHRESRHRAEAEVAAAAAAPLQRAWPRALPRLEPSRHFEELQLRQARAANPAARLPAFTYNRSVKHNVKDGGEEAATCSVCLGAFQPGETVRLLPVCLHLFHVECIDPWLDAHSTCPICRSDTDPMMDVARLTHV